MTLVPPPFPVLLSKDISRFIIRGILVLGLVLSVRKETHDVRRLESGQGIVDRRTEARIRGPQVEKPMAIISRTSTKPPRPARLTIGKPLPRTFKRLSTTATPEFHAAQAGMTGMTGIRQEGGWCFRETQPTLPYRYLPNESYFEQQVQPTSARPKCMDTGPC